MDTESSFTISVVIPTHNRAPLVGQAIESALGQSARVHEIIVVDDGSTDNTRAVVQAAGERSVGVPIRYVHQEQRGAANARNAGISCAAGAWIAFLDSDDRWCKDKIEWQIQAIRAFRDPEPALCFTDALYVNGQGLHLSVFRRAGKAYANEREALIDSAAYVAGGTHPIHIQTVLMRRDLAREIGGFDERLKIYEDNDFVFRAALRTRFCLVNRPCVEIDRSPGRVEGLTELYAAEDFRLQQMEYEHAKWLAMTIPPHVRGIVMAQMQRICAGWSSLHLMRGDERRAREAIRAALGLRVTLRAVVKWALVSFFPAAAHRIVLRRYERSRRSMLIGLDQPL